MVVIKWIGKFLPNASKSVLKALAVDVKFLVHLMLIATCYVQFYKRQDPKRIYVFSLESLE